MDFLRSLEAPRLDLAVGLSLDLRSLGRRPRDNLTLSAGITSAPDMEGFFFAFCIWFYANEDKIPTGLPVCSASFFQFLPWSLTASKNCSFSTSVQRLFDWTFLYCLAYLLFCRVLWSAGFSILSFPRSNSSSLSLASRESSFILV